MSDTIIYIDASNIILSAKNLDFELDILKLIRHLQDKYRKARMLYFTGNFKSMRSQFDSLVDIGVEIVYKEIYNEENKPKANCDVEISHRMT